MIASTGDLIDGQASSEIISLGNENLVCSNIEDYYIDVFGAVGASLKDYPVICGGHHPDPFLWFKSYTSNKCYVYKNHTWQFLGNMANDRAYAAAIVYDNSLYIFGGNGFRWWNPFRTLTASEIISKEGDGIKSTKITDLKIALSMHAITWINDTVSIITGGKVKCTPWPYPDESLSSSWYFNHVTKLYDEGPVLLKGRYGHASGTLIDHGTNETIPVVSGGWVNSSIKSDSTEFLVNGIWTNAKLNNKVTKSNKTDKTFSV